MDKEAYLMWTKCLQRL